MYASGDALGMEVLQRIELLAGAGELDRGTRDVAHRQRGAAAGVAVHAGHDDAGDADRLVERLGGVDRVLAGHRVDHQQRLGRAGGGAYLAHLGHQRLVDREPAGGVEDDHVVAFAAPGLHRTAGDLHRGLAGHDRQGADPGLGRELLQLQLGGRALGVEAGEQHAAALARLQAQRDLARGGGLAGALETDHQDRHRGSGIQVERHRAGAAELVDQHVVDDLGHRLAGGDAVQHLLPDRALTHPGGELLDHRQRHVGVQHRQPDLAHRLDDVGFRQHAAGAQAVEHPGEPA